MKNININISYCEADNELSIVTIKDNDRKVSLHEYSTMKPILSSSSQLSPEVIHAVKTLLSFIQFLLFLFPLQMVFKSIMGFFFISFRFTSFLPIFIYFFFIFNSYPFHSLNFSFQFSNEFKLIRAYRYEIRIGLFAS